MLLLKSKKCDIPSKQKKALLAQDLKLWVDNGI